MKPTAALIALAAASVLGAASCGGGGGGGPRNTPAASHTTISSPAASHIARPGEPALMSVPGYDYANIPGGPNAKELIKSDPRHLKSASAHMVVHEGNTIASLVLVQVKPQYAILPDIQQALVPAFVKDMAGSGATVTKETIHTEKVAVAKKDNTVVYCWYHAGAVTVVTGDNGPDLRDFVEAYLQAAHA